MINYPFAGALIDIVVVTDVTSTSRSGFVMTQERDVHTMFLIAVSSSVNLRVPPAPDAHKDKYLVHLRKIGQCRSTDDLTRALTLREATERATAL